MRVFASALLAVLATSPGVAEHGSLAVTRLAQFWPAGVLATTH